MSDLLLKQIASIGCRGPVITPGNADYDRARQVWNGVADRRPAAILRAADVDDGSGSIRISCRLRPHRIDLFTTSPSLPIEPQATLKCHSRRCVRFHRRVTDARTTDLGAERSFRLRFGSLSG